MKHCKACGTFYSAAAGACPKCCAMAEPPQQQHEPMAPEEAQRRRKRDWLVLLVGVPLFLFGIYGMILLMQLL